MIGGVTEMKLRTYAKSETMNFPKSLYFIRNTYRSSVLRALRGNFKHCGTIAWIGEDPLLIISATHKDQSILLTKRHKFYILHTAMNPLRYPNVSRSKISDYRRKGVM